MTHVLKTVLLAQGRDTDRTPNSNYCFSLLNMDMFTIKVIQQNIYYNGQSTV